MVSRTNGDALSPTCCRKRYLDFETGTPPVSEERRLDRAPSPVGVLQGEPEGETEIGYLGVCASETTLVAVAVQREREKERKSETEEERKREGEEIERVVHGSVAVSSRGGWWIVAVRVVDRIGRLYAVFVVAVVIVVVGASRSSYVVGDEERTKTERVQSGLGGERGERTRKERTWRRDDSRDRREETRG